ncbi:GTPase [Actinocatenispora comari]|uniref:G domain-containing protein n=1 Tax=Actinocatenispora comari TaxID=2807577 RepID=A0A8J4ENH8_9ACTN|nr:GTPase [Actinocatenispora comari]GIL30621.1 hypothetical protein NUM_58750 [Actinocatenispora comari]
MSRPESARTGADDDADPEMTAWIQQLASDEPLPDPHQPAAEPVPASTPDAAEQPAVPDRAGRAHRGSHRRGGRSRATTSGGERSDGAPTAAAAGGGPAAPAAATAGAATDHPADRSAGDRSAGDRWAADRSAGDDGGAAATGAADGSAAPTPGAPAPQQPADTAHHRSDAARHPADTTRPPSAAQHPTDPGQQQPTDGTQHPADATRQPSGATQHPTGTAGPVDDAGQRTGGPTSPHLADTAPAHAAGTAANAADAPARRATDGRAQRAADRTGPAPAGTAQHPDGPAAPRQVETTSAASRFDDGPGPSLPVPADPAQAAALGDAGNGRPVPSDPTTHPDTAGSARHQTGTEPARHHARTAPAEHQGTAEPTRHQADSEPGRHPAGTETGRVDAASGPAGHQGGHQGTAEPARHRAGTGPVAPTTQQVGEPGRETTPYPDPAVPVAPRDVPLGELPARLRALGEFVAATEGRVPADRLAPARALLARADERLALSDRHTVVVLAGTTGSGKSRLFNALTGLDLSRVGARRPTTADLHACIWEPAGTGPLLDWLGVPPENRTERESVLDGDAQRALHGLVLIDMPDFDSIEHGHRPMVERLIGSADMVLWVLDPQKYADRTVHEHYLSSLADRDAALTVVLNQVDRLPAADVDRLAADLRRLLAEDGLPAAPVHLASARTGLGVAALRSALADVVASRQAATVRIAADLTATADGLADLTDAEPPTGLATDELADRLAAHVGVAGLVDAAEQDMRRRGRRATGWLFVRRALGGRNPDRILAQERYDLDWLDDTTPADPTAATAAATPTDSVAGTVTNAGSGSTPAAAGGSSTAGTSGPARAPGGTSDAGASGPARPAGDAGTDGPAGTAGVLGGAGPAHADREPADSGAGTSQPAGSEDARSEAATIRDAVAGTGGAAVRGGAARPSGAGGRHGAGDGRQPVPEREAPRRVGLGGVLRSGLGPALDRLPAPWRDSLRGALTEQVPTLAGRLAALPAQAARGTRPAWWTVLGVLQWVCGAAAVIGAGWLIAATVSAAVPDPALAALWLLVGGVLVGVLASLAALPLVRRAARTERGALDAALRSAVAAAARDCVQDPVEAELTAYRTAHAALATARGRR